MDDPLEMPVARAEFTLADGEVLEQEWSMKSLSEEMLQLGAKPPRWLEGARKKWDHPQDPILFTGTVTEGFEDHARALLGLGPPVEDDDDVPIGWFGTGNGESPFANRGMMGVFILPPRSRRPSLSEQMVPMWLGAACLALGALCVIGFIRVVSWVS